MSRSARLEGRTVLVTGAASGIGQAVSVLAARDGADVLCADVAEPATTIDLIEQAGGKGRAVELDVSDPTMWASAVEQPVDGLAACAGILSDGPDTVLEQTIEGWRRVIDVNLTGIWLGMRAVLPGMVERGSGSIVNISSLSAAKGMPNLMAYSASKGGVVGLTRQAAVEYGPKGVRVNCILPGAIRTPLQAKGQARRTERGATTGREADSPLGRLGEPHELAEGVAFLLSDDAAFVTGQAMNIDGGWSA
jgi:NAD(P)-dependent dehydrogenase (short-subunit alcohol dehydrogenase family)